MKKLMSLDISLWFRFGGAAFLVITILGNSARGQTYLGAEAVLRQVEEKNSNPVKKDQKPDELAKFRADLEEFRQAAGKLPVDEAARRWLDLVDRSVKVRQQTIGAFNSSVQPPEPAEVLSALPPPGAWGALAKAIAARQGTKGRAETTEMGLRLLAAALTGDADSRKRELTSLQAKANSANGETVYFYNSLLQQLSQSMLAMSDDPEASLKALERQVDLAGRPGRSSELSVPNLVAQVGSDKAEAFLRKALVAPNVVLNFEAPNETSRLAQKIALELIAQLKSPQWGLVNSLEAVDLYEALDKRFAQETNNPAPIPGLPDIVEGSMGGEDMNHKSEAQLFYLLGLIAKERTQDAVVMAKKLGGQRGLYFADQAYKEMEKAGYTTSLDNFFYELLSQDPTLMFWDEYVPLAAKAGKTERMLALARAAAARDDLSDNKKAAIHRILFKALLAADAVDEGVQEIRAIMAADDSVAATMGYGESKGQLGITLAQIGVLMQKPEWTQEGIVAAKAWLTNDSGQGQFRWQVGSISHSLNEILLQLNRGPEAESMLTEALAAAVRTAKAQPQNYYGNVGNGPLEILKEMAVLYHRVERQGDVLTLLQQSPNWGAKDLSELLESDPWETEYSLRPLPTGSTVLPIDYLAGSAEIAAGQNEQAAKMIDELLNRRPALDRGYELLLALKGTNAIARLDELFALDPFEERPLIWKAHVLRQQNRLAEAEKTIRQAIAIDPSEGEEGRGDRMRAYAELADIREAQGDKKEADSMREIVKAIRISEDADRFYEAGLLKRAVPMYEEGLTHFADAYCIQSRLAIQLSEEGKNEEAEEHYRRAYELMPDSFGRVESHCFGCERVFDGERPQSIADRVFTKLVAERPDKPQVHYLLAYLREEQERFNEARTNYLEATRLDPDYLNAWSRLQGISEHVVMTAKERDTIAFNILRLDPLQRHCAAQLNYITDLAALWNAADAAARRRPPAVTNLFTLTASKAALEKQENTASPAGFGGQWRGRQRYGQEALSPGGAVAQTVFVQVAGQMILAGDRMMNE